MNLRSRIETLEAKAAEKSGSTFIFARWDDDEKEGSARFRGENWTAGPGEMEDAFLKRVEADIRARNLAQSGTEFVWWVRQIIRPKPRAA